MNFFIKNRKILTFIITFQESFIAIIPFFILTGFVTLLNMFINTYQLNILFITPNQFSLFTKNLQAFSSLIPAVSIAYFFAKRIKVSEIISIILSITLLISIEIYKSPNNPIILSYGFTPVTILAPILATFSLKKLYPIFSLNIHFKDKIYAYRLFNYLLVFFMAFLASMIVYMILDYIFNFFLSKFNPLKLDLPQIILLIIRNILVQIFWFFGMHGEHMVNALFGKELLFKEIFPNLTYGEFQRIFVSIGGAGAGLALLISIIISSKDKSIKKIAYIASPFTIFNIDNILIFLVIVFNFFLFVPFVLIPILNISIAYLLIDIFQIKFNNHYILWTMPIFFDSYLKTQNFVAILIQIVILFADIFIYTYSLKKFFKYQSSSTQAAILEHNLNLEEELKAKSDIKAFQANQEIINANVKLFNIIHNLSKDKLFIYYQPKVDINNYTVNKFEALLRYKNNNKIQGPFFLETIEKAGLAPIIDIWVCKEIKKDLKKFKNLNCNQTISINLHPDTLKNDDAINKIIEFLKNENIIFEIVEKSYLNKNAKNNIQKLKSNNFKISLDDYGTGYSSLETLLDYEIDELKIDKTIIDRIETKKGYLICSHITALCKDLNISIVAEGVERKKQLEILKKLNVNLIQGYIFSPALPLKEAVEFAKKFKTN